MELNSGKKKYVRKREGAEKESREPEIPLERLWADKSGRSEIQNHSCAGLCGQYKKECTSYLHV